MQQQPSKGRLKHCRSSTTELFLSVSSLCQNYLERLPKLSSHKISSEIFLFLLLNFLSFSRVDVTCRICTTCPHFWPIFGNLSYLASATECYISLRINYPKRNLNRCWPGQVDRSGCFLLYNCNQRVILSA